MLEKIQHFQEIQEICWYEHISLHMEDKPFKLSMLVSKKIQRFPNNA